MLHAVASQEVTPLAGERWRRRGLALEAANAVRLVLARVLRRARERLGAGGLGYRFHEPSGDRRVHLVEVELPASAPLVIGFYVSTEESRPITWGRMEARLRRVLRAAAAEAPPRRDLFLALVLASPRGRPTGPAARAARRSRVALGRPREVLEALHRYLAKRLHGLLEALREKNVKAYGPLAGLLRALYLLASRLGHVDVALADVEAAIRA